MTTTVRRIFSLLFLLAAPEALGQGFTGIQVLPEEPTLHDLLQITVAEFSGFDPEFELVSVDEDRIVLAGTYSNFGGVPLGDAWWNETFIVGPLAAGDYLVEFRFTGPSGATRVYSQTVIVSPPETVLSLHDLRYRVRVDWRNPYPPGGSGQGFAEALTDESGYFWFFGPGNVEVTVKILDGRALNGHWWVFIANLSTVEFTVTVEDCWLGALPFSCAARTYHNPPFQNGNFIDTSAFREVPPPP